MSDFKSDVREVVSQKFNVRVDLTPGATQAVIEGENINTAKEELELILQYYFNQNCAVLDIPIAAIPEICGEKDEKLVRFQNLQIQVTVDRVAGRLWICGLAKPADTAYKKFTSDIERWKSHNTEIPILESRHAGMLVGPRGENLRRMQEETGATITVKSLNDGSQAVHITGTTPEITQKGTKAVECCIHNADTRRPQQAPNNQCDPIGVSSRGKPQPYRNRY